MRTHTAALVAGLFLVVQLPAHAQSSPPSAPTVTAGAALKQLTFDWDPVAGTHVYWLLEQKSAGHPFERIGKAIPAARTSASVFVAAHLFDWNGTRYAVEACNAAGCTSSDPIDPAPLMLDVIGYVKASNTEPFASAGPPYFFDSFGYETKLSSDGKTLVVTAAGESSDASGVNGDQFNNDSLLSGAVYVFRRHGDDWQQEAYLKDLVDAPSMYFGSSGGSMRALAISGDGSWLAVGSQRETVNGQQIAGRVYMFRRGHGGNWAVNSVLTAPTPAAGHRFGDSLNMSDDGKLLKVSVYLPGNYYDIEPSSEIHFFARQGNTWTHAGMLPAIYEGWDCSQSGMSGDGRTLIVVCHNELILGDRLATLKRAGNDWVLVDELALGPSNVNQPVALDHHGKRMASVECFAICSVILHGWDGGAWVREAELPAPAPGEGGQGDAWGFPIEFSRDGRIVAIPDMFARAAGVGVMDAVTPGTTASGAVLVYERAKHSPDWQLRSILKAPNAEEGQEDAFGISLSISGDGKTLAIGAAWEDSNARGIDGDRTNNDSLDAGAVYLY